MLFTLVQVAGNKTPPPHNEHDYSESNKKGWETRRSNGYTKRGGEFIDPTGKVWANKGNYNKSVAGKRRLASLTPEQRKALSTNMLAARRAKKAAKMAQDNNVTPNPFGHGNFPWRI